MSKIIQLIKNSVTARLVEWYVVFYVVCNEGGLKHIDKGGNITKWSML